MRESHSYIPPLASRLVPSHNLRMWRLICVPNKHAGAPQLPSVLTHKLWLPTTNISGSPWTMTRSPFHEGDFCCCVCSVGLLSWPSKAAFCTRCWYCHFGVPLTLSQPSCHWEPNLGDGDWLAPPYALAKNLLKEFLSSALTKTKYDWLRATNKLGCNIIVYYGVLTSEWKYIKFMYLQISYMNANKYFCKIFSLTWACIFIF